MRAEAPVRIKKKRKTHSPVIAMGGLVFDFALSSNSPVDVLNDVCSGINTELSRELSAKEKPPPRDAFIDPQLH